MPIKKIIIITGLLLSVLAGYGQTNRTDSAALVADTSMVMDTSFDYGDLLEELGSFLDSIMAPRSYFLLNVSATSGYFDFKSTDSTLSTFRKLILSPTIGYYHKSGPGISVSGNMINDGSKLLFYQYGISPSFDFIQGKKAIGGISYTRYFTKDSLAFYTTPLQNEVTGYFLYRKSWLQPGLNAAYGWGSRSDLEKRQKFLRLSRLRRLRRLGILVTTTTTTDENIEDFSLTASARHSFYWIGVVSPKDYIKLTPMFNFSAGTQKYGFNESTGTTAATALNTDGILLSAGNTNLDDKSKFQPLFASFSVKTEYTIGKFFIQPQFILEYYFPDAGKQLSFFYSFNAGFMF